MCTNKMKLVPEEVNFVSKRTFEDVFSLHVKKLTQNIFNEILQPNGGNVQFH